MWKATSKKESLWEPEASESIFPSFFKGFMNPADGIPEEVEETSNCREVPAREAN